MWITETHCLTRSETTGMKFGHTILGAEEVICFYLSTCDFGTFSSSECSSASRLHTLQPMTHNLYVPLKNLFKTYPYSVIYFRMFYRHSPDVVLCGWLGSKNQITNYYRHYMPCTLIMKTVALKFRACLAYLYLDGPVPRSNKYRPIS